MTDMDISLPEPDGLMHYVLLNGRRPSAWSEDQVRAIVAAEVAEERERIAVLERLVIDAAYTLEKARIWNGMGWTYNPLHPVHYAPMRERLHNECDNIAAIRRRE